MGICLVQLHARSRGVEEAVREQKIAGPTREVKVGVVERRMNSRIGWVVTLVQEAEATFVHIVY